MGKQPKNTPVSKIAEYDKALGKADAQMYVLRLCVSGMTPRSKAAVKNLAQICQEHLEGQYQLEVIDLYQQPALAATHHIIATPTLLKSYPPPLRRLIGDLSDTEATLRRLGIVTRKNGAA